MLHDRITYDINDIGGAVKCRYEFSSFWCFLKMVTLSFVWNIDNTNIWI